MAALLTVNAGADKVQRYISNCNAMGIEVMPPMSTHLEPFHPQVTGFFGLSAVGISRWRDLPTDCLREADGPFASLAELCDRLPPPFLTDADSSP